jgi:5'-3' exonuclease
MQGFATRDGRPTGALYGFLMMVLKTYEEIQPDYIAACFDLPKPTFRHIKLMKDIKPDAQRQMMRL